MRRWASVILVVALGLMSTGTTQAALGPRFGIHERVTSTAYEAPMHHIRGRVGIVNKTDQAALVRCRVVALLKGPGDRHKKGSDGVKVRVPGKDSKRPHFAIEIRDEAHDFDNLPSKVTTHCHKLR